MRGRSTRTSVCSNKRSPAFSLRLLLCSSWFSLSFGFLAGAPSSSQLNFVPVPVPDRGMKINNEPFRFNTKRYHPTFMLSAMVWEPLDDLRNMQDASKLCEEHNPNEDENGDDEYQPKLAKDVEYASAVLKAWREEVEVQAVEIASLSKNNPKGQTGKCCVVGSKFVYPEYANGKGDQLNGYLVIPSHLVQSSDKTDSIERERERERERVPAIILFHTGAGPQDIFLRWKADVLVREFNCAVLIADIISDPEGYAWTDRERYDAARRSVLAADEGDRDEQGAGDGDGDGEGAGAGTGTVARWKLRRVIAAAIRHLTELEFVQGDTIAAMGWCMGGHPILELGLMQEDCVKSLISYHGVFDGVKYHDPTVSNNCNSLNDDKERKETKRTQVLICNGIDDPFVQQKDVEKAKHILESQGRCDVKVLNFEKVKHGFTNPAQDCNPSDAFAFNESAAAQSWNAAIELLQDTLYRTS